MKTVKVTANPKSGQIFTLNAGLGKDGKQYGYIRLEETEPRIDMSSGVARVTSPRSALKTFLASDWDKVSSHLTLGKVLPGQIIVTESTEKIGEAEPKINPSTEAVLKHNGAPIYRYSSYDPSGNAQDTILAFDGQVSANATVVAGAEALKA